MNLIRKRISEYQKQRYNWGPGQTEFYHTIRYTKIKEHQTPTSSKKPILKY